MNNLFLVPGESYENSKVIMEEQSVMVDPAIFEHLQERIDEDTAFRDVSYSPS
jgi:hypothetical protein